MLKLVSGTSWGESSRHDPEHRAVGDGQGRSYPELREICQLGLFNHDDHAMVIEGIAQGLVLREDKPPLRCRFVDGRDEQYHVLWLDQVTNQRAFQESGFRYDSF